MNTEREGRQFMSVIKSDTSFGKEAAGDFSLPDYMPEIKRLLFVSAKALPEGKFLNGGALELDGTVAYTAVYVGDDGSLTAAPLTAEYTADTSLPFVPENTEMIFVDTEIENVTYRATGPRSLNVKSRLRFHVMCDGLFEAEDAVADGEGRVSENGTGIERLREEIRSVERRRGSVTAGVTGEISAPGGARPVLCGGELFVTSAVPGEAEVRADGKVVITVLFVGDGGGRRSVRCEIPFSSSVPVGSDGKFSGARAWGRAASVNVTPAEDGSGVYTVSCEYDLEAEAYTDVPSSVCTDSYSTVYETENEYRDLEFPVLVAAGTKRLDVAGSAELKAGGAHAETICASPSVCQLSVSVSDGKIVAAGNVKVRAVVGTEDDVFVRETDVLIKTDLADAPDGVSAQDLQCAAFLSAFDADVSVSGETLNAKCDAQISYCVCRRRKAKPLTLVKLGEKLPDGAPQIRAYYPERDESVWNVCKKYRADRAKVMQNNSFEGDVAKGGVPVIIM